jgi:hypothetical protein
MGPCGSRIFIAVPIVEPVTTMPLPGRSMEVAKL